MYIYKDINGILGDDQGYYKEETIWEFWCELENFEAEQYKNQEEWFIETMNWMEKIEVF